MCPLLTDTILTCVPEGTVLNGETGTDLYDGTYQLLVDAGMQLVGRMGASDPHLAILACGLAAWNTGQARTTGHLLTQGREILPELCSCVNNVKDTRRLLALAQMALGVRSCSVSLASKLLHFLSPGEFPILDRHVCKAIGRSLRPGLYPDYCESIRDAACEREATVRSVEVALWRCGKKHSLRLS